MTKLLTGILKSLGKAGSTLVFTSTAAVYATVSSNLFEIYSKAKNAGYSRPEIKEAILRSHAGETVVISENTASAATSAAGLTSSATTEMLMRIAQETAAVSNQVFKNAVIVGSTAQTATWILGIITVGGIGYLYAQKTISDQIAKMDKKIVEGNQKIIDGVGEVKAELKNEVVGLKTLVTDEFKKNEETLTKVSNKMDSVDEGLKTLGNRVQGVEGKLESLGNSLRENTGQMKINQLNLENTILKPLIAVLKHIESSDEPQGLDFTLALDGLKKRAVGITKDLASQQETHEAFVARLPKSPSAPPIEPEDSEIKSERTLAQRRNVVHRNMALRTDSMFDPGQSSRGNVRAPFAPEDLELYQTPIGTQFSSGVGLTQSLSFGDLATATQPNQDVGFKDMKDEPRGTSEGNSPRISSRPIKPSWYEPWKK